MRGIVHTSQSNEEQTYYQNEFIDLLKIMRRVEGRDYFN